MVTVIALILQVLISLVSPVEPVVVTIPAKPAYAPRVVMLSALDNEDDYWCDVYDNAEDEFTKLFNSYNYKRSSNGRSMINGKFVKMGN